MHMWHVCANSIVFLCFTDGSEQFNFIAMQFFFQATERGIGRANVRGSMATYVGGAFCMPAILRFRALVPIDWTDQTALQHARDVSIDELPRRLIARMRAVGQGHVSGFKVGDGEVLTLSRHQQIQQLGANSAFSHCFDTERSVSNFATFYRVSSIETMKPSAYSSNYDKLRAWLKSEREERGLSLREVSEKWGRHHSIVGKLEQNRRRIDIIEYVEYCRVLGADPHEGLDVLTSPAVRQQRKK